MDITIVSHIQLSFQGEKPAFVENMRGLVITLI